MKKKNIIIVCIVAALGIAAFAVVKTKSQSSTIEQNYHIEDVDAITKLYLSNKLDVNLLLERVGTGDADTLWLVYAVGIRHRVRWRIFKFDDILLVFYNKYADRLT